MSRFRNVILSEPFAGGVRFLTLYSPALRRRADVTIYLPEGREQEPLPLLILLHGVYGSHWNWWALGNAPQTAQAMLDAGDIRPMAIAMPSDGLWGDGTAYVPHPQFNAETWIVEDVPQCLGEVLPQIRTDGFYLAGNSMGGFGALRLGLKYAAKVRGISAHSSITQLEDLKPFVRDPIDDYMASGIENTEIAYWLNPNRAAMPPIRFDCGYDDPLLEANRALHALLLKRGVEHRYEEREGGHTWDYWKQQVRNTLRFVSQLEQRAARVSSRA